MNEKQTMKENRQCLIIATLRKFNVCSFLLEIKFLNENLEIK